MEGRVWQIVCSLLATVQGQAQRDLYSTQLVLMVGLWAILHDRPFCWACCPEHWSPAQRPRRLPHPSTLSRRWRREDLQRVAEQLHCQALARLPHDQDAAIDGKPLIISDVSQDWEAKNGRGTRGMARGYKLHAVVTPQAVVCCFEVQPLNMNERRPAERLLQSLPPWLHRVAADGNYDSSKLHQQLEHTGVRLYTPILNGYAGPRSHRRRKVLQRLMQHPLGIRLKLWRDHIERSFARIGNVGFGLKGLPNWVRRLHRVRRWVAGKLLLHHAWLIAKHAS